MGRMQQDWFVLWVAVDELEEYLLSPVLHWPLPKKKNGVNIGDLPRLTPGIVCLAKARLSVQNEWEGNQEYIQTIERIDQIRNKWRVNWGKKAEQEFSERLRLWKAYVVEDLGEDQNRSDYRIQVRTRTILELLKDEVLRESPNEQSLLSRLDEQVQLLCSQGSFVWEDQYRLAFPENRYWFLYQG
jgi:hypothetical protein